MRQRIFNERALKKLFSLILLTAFSANAFLVAAQTRRAAPGAPKTVPAKQPTGQGGNQTKSCNGGWSGIITFAKTRSYAQDTGKVKQIPHGTNHKKYSQDYKYAGRIVVDGSQNPRSVTTNSQVILTDVRKKWSRDDQMDSCFYDGKGSREQWTETNESDSTHAFGEGAAQFWMNVNELSGTYSFNFRFPEAAGTNDRTYSKTAGGWCNPEFNKPESRANKYPEKVSGEGAEISDQKFDPTRPGVLSGSKTWETGGSTPSTKTVFTVMWSFKRCPAPVEVTDIRFDEHFYPDYQTWREIETARGTIDGNRVRIRATVTNFSGETKFPQIKFNETVENWVLPDGEKSIRLEPGESREVELEWDTSGYAWRGKGYDAESYRKIKVEAEDGGRTSQLTKLIVVNPRPVILVHGLWSNAAAWAGYDKFFETGHSAAWKSYAVGANPAVAKMNTGETFGNAAQTKTISQNAAELGKQIEFVRKDKNAWHVDIVAHSMGGLISRYYINELMPLNYIGNKPAVTKLIMLGTPNQGSPCADLMFRALSATGSKPWALYELMPSVVKQFNQSVKNRKGVRFSALAGWKIPNTCQSPASGDGVVSIGSARWFVMDWKYSDSLAHTDLTSRADFGAFVFPRLSIGPRGNHDPELVAENDSFEPPVDRYGFNSVFQKASYKRTQTDRNGDDDSTTDDAPIEGLTLANQVTLAANQTTEIEIPMTDASRASIVFAAPPNVSATLLDSSGAIVGKNTGGSPESKQMFRTIGVEKAVKKGTWKLKLESRETSETSVILAAFADPNPLILQVIVGKPNAAKQIALQAKLTANGAPVSGANLKAKVQSADGKTHELTLRDDGASGDGAANDGIYGASVEKLTDGDYLVEASAETGGQTRSASAAFRVGAPPVKTPVKKTGVK